MDNISFIIPIFNVNIDNLKNCIKSIERQCFKEYEIILINDGSTDKGIETECKIFCEKNNKIRYIYEENSGSAVARNKGLDAATMKYIVFVDADDMITDNYKEMLDSIEEKDFEFIVFDYCYWQQNNEKLCTFSKKNNFIKEKDNIISNILFYPEKMNNFMFGSIWAKIFSRKFINDNNIRFIKQLRKAQDRRFMLEVVQKSTNILYYPFFVYKYRINDISITHKINYKMIDYYEYLYHELAGFCKENNISDNCTKFLQYNIVNELVLLTTFHADNEKSYKEIKKEYKEIYIKFDLDKALKKIKIKDIPSKKGKLKLLLYKANLIYLLYKLFRVQQKIKNKNIFSYKEEKNA